MSTISFSFATEVPADAEALGVPVYAGGVPVPGAAADLDAAFLAARGFEGKVGQTLPMLADDGSTVIAVGVGSPEKLGPEALRRAAAAFARATGTSRRAAFSIGGLAVAKSQLTPFDAAQAVSEGASLGAYTFTVYKTEGDLSKLEHVVVVGGRGKDGAAGVERGARIGAAVCMARDLVNEPPGTATPTHLATLAAEIAEREGLEILVLDELDIASERLGGLAGVAAGSDEPARLIQLTWSPPEADATVALVGKGITFDSGGLSIKTGDGMMTMKTDMSGGAAVLAAMSVIKDVAPRTKVIGIVPATENMPSGRAVKPGDVLRFRNGKTAEVLNTDAEGRLVLADGLCLTVEQEPDAIVDIATLTGACVVALGKGIGGLMGNNDDVINAVRAAGERTGEPFWPLPLPDTYREHIASEIADIKNIGLPGQAGTLSAGLFLKEFVADVPWAHLDIAGPSHGDKDDGYVPKGGTAFGTRTLIDFVANFEKPTPTTA